MHGLSMVDVKSCINANQDTLILKMWDVCVVCVVCTVTTLTLTETDLLKREAWHV